MTAVYWSPAHGIYSLDLNGTLSPGGIQQTFDTISGLTYQVTFALAGNPNWGPNYLMQVSTGNTTQDYASVATANWSNRTFVFTAVSQATTLTFIDITPGGSLMRGGPTLDDVRITKVPAFTEPFGWSEEGCKLSLVLPTNGNCSVEAATNLAGDLVIWEELTNFVISGTSVQFTDSAATNNIIRFYRLRVSGP